VCAVSATVCVGGVAVEVNIASSNSGYVRCGPCRLLYLWGGAVGVSVSSSRMVVRCGRNAGYVRCGPCRLLCGGGGYGGKHMGGYGGKHILV